MSSIYADMREWDEAQADLVSDEGLNASERVTRRIAAAQRMRDIEARYENLSGGFRGEAARVKDRVKRVVDAMPPLTDDQLVELVKLLSLP